jgi:hypothetical protein
VGMTNFNSEDARRESRESSSDFDQRYHDAA